MMRRRVAVAVALFLLAFTATAYAECSWVLGKEQPTYSGVWGF